MSVILTSTNIISIIQAEAMYDGAIAQITHSNYSDDIGRIVMRNGSNLVTIGEISGKSWTGFFSSSCGNSQLKVRLLKRGEQLTIV